MKKDNKIKDSEIVSSKAIHLAKFQVLVHLGLGILNYLLKVSGFYFSSFDITQEIKDQL